MAIQSSGNKGLFTEINITPLTDIFLVLLIIMMVIAPMFQQMDNNIILPSINSGLTVDKDLVTVAITSDSKFYVGPEPVEEDKLTEKLTSVLPQEEGAEKKLVVKADSKTKTKYIMSVMHAAQEAGFEKLTVAGEPLSRKQQRELEEGGIEKRTSAGIASEEIMSAEKKSGRYKVNLPE